MKQSKIIAAYRTLQRISAQPLPLNTAYSLHKLRLALQPQWDFQAAEENKILAECGGVVDPFGNVRFPDDPPAGVEPNETNEYGKSFEKFNKRLEELSELDTEVTVELVKLDAKALKLNLSMNDISALDGLVEIEC